MTATIRLVRTIVLIGLYETNTIGYYGHLVLRLMGCLVLMYTSRVVCQGRLTMEEIIFSLKGRGARPHSKMSQQLVRG